MRYHPKVGDRFKPIERATGRAARAWPMECIKAYEQYVTATDSAGHMRQFDNHSWQYEQLDKEEES